MATTGISTTTNVNLEQVPILDLVKSILKRISSYDWVRRSIVISLLGALLVRSMRRKKSVKGKLVLITGAATGIGREQAFAFARAGAKLALWDINEEALTKTGQDVRKETGAEVETYTVNLAEKEQVYSVADQVRETQGSVWCLVNNAGIISGQELLNTPDSRIELSMKVNSHAYFWTTKAFLPDMLKNNSGHIVGISSAAGVFPSPRMVDYCTSKFAARGFMEALQTELQYLGKTGVGCSVVCPAHVRTDLFKGFNIAGVSMSPEYVASQVLDAVQYKRFHVYLPWALNMGIFWQTIMPDSVWAFFMSFSYSAMKNWKSDQANKVFNKMGAK